MEEPEGIGTLLSVLKNSERSMAMIGLMSVKDFGLRNKKKMYDVFATLQSHIGLESEYYSVNMGPL